MVSRLMVVVSVVALFMLVVLSGVSQVESNPLETPIPTIVCKSGSCGGPLLMTATPRPAETPLPFITPIVGCPLWCDAEGCRCQRVYLPYIEKKEKDNVR